MGGVATGVDFSRALLIYAQNLTDQVNWIQEDAMTLRSLQGESFDIVTSSIMLMDIPDHKAVFEQSCRILKPGGIMVWLVMHPCFQSPFSHPLEDGSRKVYQYAPQYWKSHGDGTLRSTLGAYHRPISQHINDFMKTGFVIPVLF
jgi:ubiquinone/menaquinone biosynthesis C-methylase UbiE